MPLTVEHMFKLKNNKILQVYAPKIYLLVQANVHVVQMYLVLVCRKELLLHALMFIEDHLVDWLLSKKYDPPLTLYKNVHLHHIFFETGNLNP